MQAFTIKWAAETLNAPLIGDAVGDVTGVSIDTRTLQPGDLFFALKGENSDGHEYVRAAFEKGAIAAVVSETVPGVNGPQIVVADTLRAFGDLAGAYRRQFAIPVVGVTGSVGKTSTKEMIAAVLRTRYNVLANEKNFNNEIGVPLTLFKLDKAHEVAVIEMGMRGLGEIDRLAEIAAPTIGLITNIGYAHIERLGSRENILRAKTELFQRLPQDGIAIIPADSNFYEQLLERIPDDIRKITFSATENISADIRLRGVILIRYFFYIGDAEYRINLSGMATYAIANALAALSVGFALDVDMVKAIQSLEDWHGIDGRMSFSFNRRKRIKIIDDCYNASPESMEAALTSLDRFTTVTCVAILGDMKELGDFSEEAHDRIGRKAGGIGLRLLITVGELAKGIAKAAKGVAPIKTYHFADADEAAAQIWDLAQKDDTVLVKGSHAMQMEKIVAVLLHDKDGEPEYD